MRGKKIRVTIQVPESIRANEDLPIKAMSLADLAECVKADISTEREMSLILQRAADLAEEVRMPALAMLFDVLSEEPSEIAAMWHSHVLGLAEKLHADTDGPALCRLVSLALAQFDGESLKTPEECDACSNEATHVNGPGNPPVGQWCDACDPRKS